MLIQTCFKPDLYVNTDFYVSFEHHEKNMLLFINAGILIVFEELRPWNVVSCF